MRAIVDFIAFTIMQSLVLVFCLLFVGSSQWARTASAAEEETTVRPVHSFIYNFFYRVYNDFIGRNATVDTQGNETGRQLLPILAPAEVLLIRQQQQRQQALAIAQLNQEIIRNQNKDDDSSSEEDDDFDSDEVWGRPPLQRARYPGDLGLYRSEETFNSSEAVNASASSAEIDTRQETTTEDTTTEDTTTEDTTTEDTTTEDTTTEDTTTEDTTTEDTTTEDTTTEDTTTEEATTTKATTTEGVTTTKATTTEGVTTTKATTTEATTTEGATTTEASTKQGATTDDTTTEDTTTEDTTTEDTTTEDTTTEDTTTEDTTTEDTTTEDTTTEDTTTEDTTTEDTTTEDTTTEGTTDGTDSTDETTEPTTTEPSEKPKVPPYRANLHCRCGTQPKIKVPFGSSTLETNIYPWIVAIQTKNHKHLCTGSIINSKFILTSASCLNRHRDPNGLIVEASLATPGRTVKYQVKRVIIRPDFNSGKRENDIALLEVKRPINPTQYIKYVCLPIGDKHKDDAGTLVTLVDQPKTKKISLIHELVQPIWVRRCMQLMNQNNVNLPDEAFCTAPPTRHCNGDTGGSFVTKGQGYSYAIKGVIINSGCYKHKRPAVYTQVTRYMNWILTNAKKGEYCRLPNFRNRLQNLNKPGNGQVKQV